MRLSVVIPAFNEAARLPRTLSEARAWLDAHLSGDYELLVVDDGSTDDTCAIVARIARDWPRLRLLRQPENRGKGAAVRRGMLEARGEVRLFMDADHSTHIREVTKVFEAIEAGAEVVIASRRHPDSELPVRQGRLREAMGVAFNRLMRGIVGLPYEDTQCGFKAFTAEAAARLFPRQTLDGFGFDVEILAWARKLGMRIVEIPVRWTNDADSRVAIGRDPLAMLAELWRIRRALNREEEWMRLHHAALIVDDLEAAARFYEEVLGLKRDERPAHDFPGIYYRLAGGAQLHLMELPDPCGLHARPDHPGRDRHIALSVENLAPVRARLKAAGIAWTASRSGRAAVFVRDPAGNAIELVEEG